MKVRSATRALLKKFKEQLKDGNALADKTQVSKATISRMLAGKQKLSRRTLRKIFATFDRESIKEALAAFLADQVPRELREEVRVCVRGRDFEESGACQPAPLPVEPLLEKYLSLSKESQFRCRNCHR